MQALNREKKDSKRKIICDSKLFGNAHKPLLIIISSTVTSHSGLNLKKVHLVECS